MHDRAVLERRAGVSFVGARSYLDAQGPSYDGVLLAEVLDHFTDHEYKTEWDILAKLHGDAMCPALMERTHAQRSYDALQRIVALAAGSTEAGPAITVDIVVDRATFEHELDKATGGDPDPIPPWHAPNRRCEDSKGRVIDPRVVVGASLVGHVRRIVMSADGVVLDMGRRKRLFTGPLRDAVLAAARRCTYVGCQVPGPHCEADHLVPYSERGPTNARNGGPGCKHHNRWKNNGTRTFRDAKGLWHTFRPDGTEIGWPAIFTNFDHLEVALHALSPDRASLQTVISGGLEAFDGGDVAVGAHQHGTCAVGGAWLDHHHPAVGWRRTTDRRPPTPRRRQPVVEAIGLGQQ